MQSCKEKKALENQEPFLFSNRMVSCCSIHRPDRLRIVYYSVGYTFRSIRYELTGDYNQASRLLPDNVFRNEPDIPVCRNKACCKKRRLPYNCRIAHRIP